MIYSAADNSMLVEILQFKQQVETMRKALIDQKEPDATELLF